MGMSGMQSPIRMSAGVSSAAKTMNSIGGGEEGEREALSGIGQKHNGYVIILRGGFIVLVS